MPGRRGLIRAGFSRLRGWPWVAVALLLFALSACKGGDNGGNPVVSVRISNGLGVLAPYEVEQLSAVATFDDGTTTDVTSLVRWSSSDATIVTVDPNGRAIALAPGSATIKATHPTGGVSTTLGLSVVMAGPATLDSLQILPSVGAMSVAPGESVYVMALGQYSDGTRVDFSNQAQWNSSNALVAPIASDGKAMASATGTTQLFGTVVDPDDALHTVQGSKYLNVQLISPGPDAVRDWVYLNIPAGGTDTVFLEGQETDPPGPVAPQLKAYYTQVYALVPVTRLLMTGSTQATMDAWVAGNTVGQYDVAVSAYLRGELPGSLPGFSLRAGPDVPGSSGHITLTRMGAPGGRVHGYMVVVGCLYFGETVYDCGYVVDGAFSLQREADETYTAEGTGAPVLLTLDTPTQGAVDTTSSYYLLDGLAGDAGYYLRLYDPSDDVSLTVAADDTFSPAQCTSQQPGLAVELCGVITGPAQTALYARVDFQGTGDGAVFKLLPTASPYANEGDSSVPADLGPVPVSHSGMVDNTVSYYAVGVPINTTVRVDVTTDALTSLASTVEVFTDAGFSLPFCSVQVLSASHVACGATTDGTTDVLFVRVTGVSDQPGESFFLSAVAYPSEGLDTAPEPLALRSARNGTVGAGYSYYTLATEPGRDYEFTLTPNVDGVTLEVFEDAFGTPLCTQAAEPPSGPEGGGSPAVPGVCTLTATGSALNVRVDGSATLGGTSFQLYVRPLFTSEGTVDTPVELTVGTPHSGAVASDETSYYAVTVDRFTDYTVVMKATMPDQGALIFGDAAFTQLVCTMDPGTRDPVTGALEACLVPAGSYDRVYVAVTSIDGGSFTLYVGVGALFTEAYLLTPGEVHYGTVDATESHYAVMPVLAADFDIDLTDAGDAVDLAVYGGADGTTLLCTSAAAGTADEHCHLRADEYPLDIVVDGSATVAGTSYLIALSEPQWAPEGLVDTPVELTPALERVSRVDATTSYYWIPATAGKTYRAQLTVPTADVTVQMFDAAGFSGTPPCESANPGTSDESCTVTASGSAVYVAVVGPATGGAGYRLQVGLLAESEGQTTPVDLTLDVARPSQVDTTYSDYKLTTTAGTIYAFDLSGATDVVSMAVFSDALFGVQVCATDFPTTDPATCLVDAPNTALYVRVYGMDTVAGAFFDLTASVAPFTPLVSLDPQVTTGGDMYFYYDTVSGNPYSFFFDSGPLGLEATVTGDANFSDFLDWFDGSGGVATVIPGTSRVYLRVSTAAVGAGQPFGIWVSP